MRQTVQALLLATALLMGPRAQATLDVTPRHGVTINWYYHNTSTQYDEILDIAPGYHRDYDGDGLADYLIVQRDTTTNDWRLFALNTAPDGAKTYTSDRTAGRDFPAQPGTFVPYQLFLPHANFEDSTDLVLVGTDRAAGSEDFTRFTFWRLNKTDTQLPTEATWTIDNVTSASDIYWPALSFDADGYPDFIVYTRHPNAAGQFVVACHDGRNGTLIWSKTLDRDPEDPGTGVVMGSVPLGFPLLEVFLLSEDAQQGSGDFDGDGRPDVLLYYSFAVFDLVAGMKAVANVNLLDAVGNLVPPYSSAWTRAYEAAGAFWAPGPLTQSDYDQDGFVDLMMTNTTALTNDLAVFTAFSLKERQLLFVSNPSDFDFGALPTDLEGYLAFDQRTQSQFVSADVDGDTWPDLNVFRPTAAPSIPIRIGLFNAYAGAAAGAGRPFWIRQFDAYDSAHWGANDFDGDDLRDFVLANKPEAPNDPVPNKVTWHIANTTISASDATVVRDFDYSADHAFSWNPATDAFESYSTAFTGAGDVDGDGQPDTFGSMSCSVDNGDDGTFDLAYGFMYIYDNPPGTGAPDRSAELEIKVQGENWMPLPILLDAFTLGSFAWVDNNDDGFPNDMNLYTQRAIVSFSYTYQVWPNLPGQAGNPFPPDGGVLPTGGQMTWSRGLGATSYDCYFGTTFAAVDGATTTSGEFLGNIVATSFSPLAPPRSGRIYYWRIDSRNAAGVTKGLVWSFRAAYRTQAARWQLYR